MALCFLACAMPVAGQVPVGQSNAADYGLRFGGGHSDNIRRAPPGAEESSGYNSAGFYFDVVRRQRRLDATLAGDVERRDYDLAGIDNTQYGPINATALVGVVPERFSWLFDDRYGQGRSDVFLPTSPQNIQEINVFATGPRVDLPLGQRTSMRLDGTRSSRSYENTGQFDSDVFEAELGFYRAIARSTEVGIGVATRDIEYVTSVADQTVDSVFLSYSRVLATGDATLRIGSTEETSGGAKRSAPLLSLAWNRDVGARSHLTLSLDNGFEDTGGAFIRSNTGSIGSPTPDNTVLSSDVYESSRVNLAYVLEHERTKFSVGGGVGKSRYQADVGLDNDERNFDFSVERRVTERARLGLRGTIFDREFVQIDRRDHDRDAELWFEKLFAARLSLRVSWLRSSRDGLNASLPYDETSFDVLLSIDLNS